MPVDSYSAHRATQRVSCKEAFSKIKDGAEKGVNLYAGGVGAARYMHEALQPVSKAYCQASKAFLPFRTTALATTPFEFWSLGESVVETTKAPGKLKIAPVLKTINSTGVILDQFVTTVEIAVAWGAQGAGAIMAVAMPLSMAAYGLQLAGVAFNGWTLHEIRKEWSEVEKILKRNGAAPDLAIYKEAVDRLTKKAMTRKEKFKQSLFGILTDGQKTKVKTLFEKSQNDRDTRPISKAFKSVQQHVKSKTAEKITLIVLTIIGLIAAAALFFVPSPLSIICWSILAVAGVGGLATFIYGLVEQRKFNNSLKGVE